LISIKANDYEGIVGYEEFRNDLAVAYFPAVAADSGVLHRLEMSVFRIRNFRLMRAPEEGYRMACRHA
jgi:poly-gamma-glutamate synthesis protein (capsule biosynthesis protein)